MSQQESMDNGTSPARKTRQQEKEELAFLNDRFASYIEQVRNLKEANLRYEFELQSVKDQLGTETDEIKRLFEAELTDARTLIDETAKEKARQQLIASNNAQRVRELEAEMKELKEELEAMKNRVNMAERATNSMDAQRKAAVSEKASLQKEVKDKDAEIADLRTSIEDLKTLLESETLCKVDYQNNLQSANEELAFRKKIHDEEIQGMRLKLSRTTYSESYESFTEGGGGNLENAIDELREKSDLDIADFKSMLETAYRDKIAKLENQSNRDAATIAQLNMELRKFTSNLNDSKGEITRLQKMIEKLEGQIDAKDNEIAHLVQKHASEVSRLNQELRALRENYDAKIREYEALMDLKVQLDQEIATYRALLQQEETRLNLTPTPRGEKRRSRTQSSEQVVKKARMDTVTTQQQQQSQSSNSISSSAAGCIQICEVDAQGRFVQIKNMSKSAESVGGFKIVHEVNGDKEITFRFHQKSKLQGGAAVSVWGSEADGAVHNPPHDIIWKNQGTWGAGTNAVTKLVSRSGEVVATFTQRSEISPVKSKYDTVDSAGASVRSFPHLDTSERDSPSVSSSTRTVRTTTTTTTTSGGQEDMFHQRGDPQSQERLNRESCVIS